MHIKCGIDHPLSHANKGEKTMNNANILIVDDEENIRLTIAQSLDPLGYQVATADNGKDALLQL